MITVTENETTRDTTQQPPPRERIDNRGTQDSPSDNNWSRPDQTAQDAQFAQEVQEYEEFRHMTIDSIKQLQLETKDNAKHIQLLGESLSDIKRQLTNLVHKIEEHQQDTVRQLQFLSEPNSGAEETRGAAPKRVIPVHGSAVAKRYTRKGSEVPSRQKPLNEKEIPSDVLFYTGMNSEVSLQRWYTKILLWQAILDWSDRQTLQCMCLRVRGEAATYIERGDVIGPATTPEDLFEMFSANFSNTATELSLSLTLDSIHMQTNEGVSDYNARFMKTLAQVGDIDESRKLIAYIKGLSSKYRDIMALARPSTLAAAMQALSLTTAFQQATNVTPTGNTPATATPTSSVLPAVSVANTEMTQLLQTLVQSVNKMSTSLEQSKSNFNNKPFYQRFQGQNQSQASTSGQPKTQIPSSAATPKPNGSSFQRSMNNNPRVSAALEEPPSEELAEEDIDQENA